MADATYRADVAVVGGGIAGIVTALQLLDEGLSVVMLDRDDRESLGGLAKWSFGGIFLVDSREQRRLGFKDDPDLALQDWLRAGELDPTDEWPVRWARAFVDGVADDVDDWLRRLGVRFFPVVHWVERGGHAAGNSVPRFHMVWGTGDRLIEVLVGRLMEHPRRVHLSFHFRHRVTDVELANGRVAGVTGTNEADGTLFRADAQSVVVAAGGYSGNIPWLRKHWDHDLGKIPETILNGSHRYADGDLHRVVENRGGVLSNLDRAWFYAAGVHHPNPRHQLHGLSIVPPKSALWLNFRGERIGPDPMVAGFDTRRLVQQVCHEDRQYSWQVMNSRIARKELAVSGSEFNDAIRNRKVFGFLKSILMGNRVLVQTLSRDCEDVIVANSVAELAGRMNALAGSDDVDVDALEAMIKEYDRGISTGTAFIDDEQVRRIVEARKYRGDRVRTCKSQTILDPGAMPLIAIREFILSRKSLGGIRTDLSCRVLSADGRPVLPGLYAVGESAGFGGGGIHGKRSLEGTFLATCIFTGRKAARSIAGVV
jgi:predicted oxidoreductase